MINTYKALTRSILEWGYVCYSNAADTHLKKLEPVHNSGLKICLGLPKFASNAATLNITQVTTLSHRRKNLIDKYLLKSASLKKHPLIPKLKLLSEIIIKNKKAKSKFIMRTVINRFNALKDKFDKIIQTELPLAYEFPLQCQLSDNDIESTTEHVYENPGIDINQIFLQTYGNKNRFYVDASCPEKTQFHGAAVYYENKNIIETKKIINHSSSTETESYAILMALRHIKNNKIKDAIIFSDSKQALTYIKNKKITAKTPATALDCKLN